VLVDTDVNEGAEGGNVGHRPLKHHAGLEVLDVVDALREGRGLECRARVAAGLFQLGNDVLDRRKAEAFVNEDARIERLERRRVPHQRANVAATRLYDLASNAVGLRVHGRSIERLVAIADTQEARALLEG